MKKAQSCPMAKFIKCEIFIGFLEVMKYKLLYNEKENERWTLTKVIVVEYTISTRA